MRTLLSAWNVPALPVQSEKSMRNASSLSGTVRRMTQLHPLRKVPSAVALVLTGVMLTTASGVELEVDCVTKVLSADVVVPTLLPDCTAKWYSVPSERPVSSTECEVDAVPSYAELSP